VQSYWTGKQTCTGTSALQIELLIKMLKHVSHYLRYVTQVHQKIVFIYRKQFQRPHPHYLILQGATKRALQLWKSIQIYTEGIHVLNCNTVAKHCKFDAHRTVVPNTITASAPAVEIKMATFTGAERAHCVFWFEETKSTTQDQRKFRTQYHKEPPSRPTIYSWHKNFV
jgi:hypothetical protein